LPTREPFSQTCIDSSTCQNSSSHGRPAAGRGSGKVATFEGSVASKCRSDSVSSPFAIA
jgi:hypothetical protein